MTTEYSSTMWATDSWFVNKLIIQSISFCFRVQSYTFLLKLLFVSQKRITFVFVKFYVKCYECGRVFRINVQKYGVSKYRCPDCGNVVPFLYLEEGPVVQACPVKVRGARSEVQGAKGELHGAKGKTHLQPLPKGGETGAGSEEQGAKSKERKGFWHRLWSAFMWLFHIIVRFLRWVAKKIRIFREKYEDADLWLFFGFSFLFVVGVIFGLWLMAQITILFSDVHSWLFQMFLKLKFML